MWQFMIGRQYFLFGWRQKELCHLVILWDCWDETLCLHIQNSSFFWNWHFGTDKSISPSTKSNIRIGIIYHLVWSNVHLHGNIPDWVFNHFLDSLVSSISPFGMSSETQVKTSQGYPKELRVNFLRLQVSLVNALSPHRLLGFVLFDWLASNFGCLRLL